MVSTSSFFILSVGLCAVVPGVLGTGSKERQVNNEVQLDRNSPSKVHEKDIISRQKRADDVDLAALQALIQQQAATIQQMQSQLTATQNEMTTLKNSLPASFSPVGFSVRFHAGDTDDGISLGSYTTLKFNDVVTNMGHNYDAQTGEFTAPVAGLYAFFLNLMSTNNHGAVRLAIVKHNVPLDVVWAQGSGDTNDQGSGQVTAHLQVGDQVWVRQSIGDAVRGSWYTIFTGYLVQAD